MPARAMPRLELAVVETPAPSELRAACAGLAADLEELLAGMREGLAALRAALDAAEQPDPLAVIQGWDHAARILDAEQQRQAALLLELREAAHRNRVEAERLLRALAATEREIDQLAFELHPRVEEAASRLFCPHRADNHHPESH